METINRLFPWAITLSAVYAVASGMPESPAMVPVSGRVFINGELVSGKLNIPFDAREELCAGHTEEDGVFQIVGMVKGVKNPSVLFDPGYNRIASNH